VDSILGFRGHHVDTKVDAKSGQRNDRIKSIRCVLFLVFTLPSSPESFARQRSCAEIQHLIAVEGAEMAQQQLTNIRHQRLEPDSAIGADWRPLSRQAAPPAPVLELLA
jgi:hypothetical protein